MSETLKQRSYLTKALERGEPVSPFGEDDTPPDGATGHGDEKTYNACNFAHSHSFRAARFELKNGAFFSLDFSSRLQMNGTLNGSHDVINIFYSTANVVIRGRQLAKVLRSLEQHHTDIVREFDNTRHDYPPKDEPMISSLVITLPEAREKNERK